MVEAAHKHTEHRNILGLEVRAAVSSENDADMQAFGREIHTKVNEVHTHHCDCC